MVRQDYKLGQQGYKMAGRWYQTKSLWFSGNNHNPASESKAIWAKDAHLNPYPVKEIRDELIILCSSLSAQCYFQTPLDGL